MLEGGDRQRTIEGRREECISREGGEFGPGLLNVDLNGSSSRFPHVHVSKTQTAWNSSASLRKWLCKSRQCRMSSSALHTPHPPLLHPLLSSPRLGLEACRWESPRRAFLRLPARQWEPGAVWRERRERTRAKEKQRSAQRRRRKGKNSEEGKKERKGRRSLKHKQWVYRLTVCIRPPRFRTGTSPCGTGTSAGPRAPSTGPSTSCRNAGGRPDVLSVQMLLMLLILHNFKHTAVNILLFCFVLFVSHFFAWQTLIIEKIRCSRLA